jgi:hypothetical protein
MLISMSLVCPLVRGLPAGVAESRYCWSFNPMLPGPERYWFWERLQWWSTKRTRHCSEVLVIGAVVIFMFERVSHLH